MAEGPMSTPLRSLPSSMGTPKIPAGRRVLSNIRHTPGAPWVGRGFEGALRGEARGEDGGLRRHPEIQHVDERLQEGCGDPGRAGRPHANEAAVPRGEDRRAHAGDKTLTRRKRVES